MKKLTNARFITLAFCGLGVFAMLSLSSCDGAGEATDQKETEKTEEATPAENANEAEHPAADSEHPSETPADTTEATEEVEHPTGGNEHPN